VIVYKDIIHLQVEVPMKTERSCQYVEHSGIKSLLLLLTVILSLLTGGLNAVASGDPHRYHANGKLTGIEHGNIITVDEKGYYIDPSVLVVNAAGMPTTLDKLSLPVHVDFEYSYMPKGPKIMSPVIVYIEETKKTTNNSRSMR
jgi:hypothetical protein